MEKIKSSSIFKILLVYFVLNGLFLKSYGQTVDETIEQVVDIKTDQQININCENFDVHYKTWQKNKLKVEYKFSFEMKDENEKDAFYKEFKREIDKQLSKIEKGYVNIKSPFNKWVATNNRFKVRFRSTNNTYNLRNFKINIVVYAHEDCRLNIIGEFCEIILDKVNADILAEVNSCKFQMGNCNSLMLKASFCKNIMADKAISASLSLNSSDITIKEIINNLNIRAEFSNVEIGRVGGKVVMDLSSSSFESSGINELVLKGEFNRRIRVGDVGGIVIPELSSSEFIANKIGSLLIAKSSFSTFKVAEIGKLKLLKSSSDKIYVDKLDVVTVPDCSFTNFFIKELTTSFTAKSSSGQIDIDKISKEFRQIDIVGEFLDMRMEFETNASYKLLATFEFPNYKFEGVKTKIQKPSLNNEIVKGWKGEEENSKSTIKFDCTSCKIRLM